MKFSIDKREKFTVLQPHEENINSLKAPELKSEIIMLNAEGLKNLIIDLSDVKYIDSSGLSAILTANRLLADDGTFILTGVTHSSVKMLINISRLDTVLKIIPTVQESIEYVMMEELERELLDDPSESE